MLRRASGWLQGFLCSLELELKLTIQHVREAIRTLNRAAQGAVEGMEWVRDTLATLDAVGANVLWTLSTQRRRHHE